MEFEFNLNNKEFMNLPVDQLAISLDCNINLRSLRALKKNNIEFVRDIFERTGGIDRLRKTKNFGEGSFKHVVSCLVNTYLSMLTEEEAIQTFKNALTISEALDISTTKGVLTDDKTVIWKSEG